MSQASIPPSNESFSFRMMESNATGLLVVPCDDEEQLNSIPGWNNVTTDEVPMKSITDATKKSVVDSHAHVKDVSPLKVAPVTDGKDISPFLKTLVHQSGDAERVTHRRSLSLPNLSVCCALADNINRQTNSTSVASYANPDLEEHLKTSICRSLPNIKLSAVQTIKTTALQKFKNVFQKTTAKISQFKEIFLREQVSNDEHHRLLGKVPVTKGEQVAMNGIKRPLENSAECSTPKFFKLSDVSDDLKNLISQGYNGSPSRTDSTCFSSGAGAVIVSSAPPFRDLNVVNSTNILKKGGHNNDSKIALPGSADLNCTATVYPGFSKVPSVSVVSSSSGFVRSDDSLLPAVPILNNSSVPWNLTGPVNHRIVSPSKSYQPIVSQKSYVSSLSSDVRPEATSLKSITIPSVSTISMPEHCHATVSLPATIGSCGVTLPSHLSGSSMISVTSMLTGMHSEGFPKAGVDSSVCNSTNGNHCSDMTDSQIARHLNTSIVKLDAIGVNNAPFSEKPKDMQVFHINSATEPQNLISNEHPLLHKDVVASLATRSSALKTKVNAQPAYPSIPGTNIAVSNELAMNLSMNDGSSFPGIQSANVEAPKVSPSYVHLDTPNVPLYAPNLPVKSHSLTPLCGQFESAVSYPQVSGSLNDGAVEVTATTKNVGPIGVTSVSPEIVTGLASMTEKVSQLLAAEQQNMSFGNDTSVQLSNSRVIENDVSISNYKVGDETQRACLGIADEYMSSGSFRSNDRTLSQKDASSTYTVDPVITSAPVLGVTFSPISSAELFTSQRDRSGSKEPSLPPSCLRKPGSAKKKLSFADKPEDDLQHGSCPERVKKSKRKWSNDDDRSGRVNPFHHSDNPLTFSFSSAQAIEMVSMIFSLCQ